MRDRQFAWSDPELAALVAELVPCADEVWRLQNGDDAECRLFQRFCDLGHYREHRTTRQGLYVVTASGRLLGSCNDRRADRVAAMVRAALERWRETSREERALPAEERAALAALWRWEDERPDDGLVLEVITRDLPRAEPPPRHRRRWTDGAWNRDYAWFRADEARRWLPAELEASAEHQVPRPLVERLVRCHLLDSVRGQVFSFAPQDVVRADLTVAVEAVEDGVATLVLRGATRAEVTGGEFARGFAAELRGSARWSVADARFVAFELVARGERWGASRFNERRRDRDPSPIGVVLRLAPPDAPRVAPAFVYQYGWRPRTR